MLQFSELDDILQGYHHRRRGDVRLCPLLLVRSSLSSFVKVVLCVFINRSRIWSWRCSALVYFSSRSRDEALAPSALLGRRWMKGLKRAQVQWHGQGRAGEARRATGGGRGWRRDQGGLTIPSCVPLNTSAIILFWIFAENIKTSY